MCREFLEWNGVAEFPSFGTWVAFNNVTFINYAPTDPQFTVIHPGESTTYVFNGLNFATVPSAPGYYIRAADTDGGIPRSPRRLSSMGPCPSSGIRP